MIYEQYPYNLYNPYYVNPAYLQQLEVQQLQTEAQKEHWEQQKKIHDMVKAISDYCSAARDLDPAYQQEAITACFIEIAHQSNIDKQKNGGGWQ